MRFTHPTLALVLLLATQPARAANEPLAATPAPAPNPARTTLAEGLGTIEPRDLLRVEIDGLRIPGRPLTRLVRVDADGNARLPYLKLQKLAGLTTDDAEPVIAKAYRDAKVLAGNSVITVLRVEAGARAANKGGPIAKGDLVAVTIDDLTGPASSSEFTVRVGDDGNVRLPLVGDIKVTDTTENRAADAIAKALRAKGILAQPQTALRVLETAAESKVKPGPVAAGDLLEIELWDLAGPGARTRIRARVAADGTIGLPLVGTINVAGLTEAHATDAIAKKYRDDHLIQNPILLARRTQSADQADVKLGPIARGEVLRVAINDLAGPGLELIHLVRVDDHGAVTLPLVGKLKVEGLTEPAATAKVTREYQLKELSQNAHISVLKINGNAPIPEDLARVEETNTAAAQPEPANPAAARTRP
jgi:protein involved in polysaccharide export with SLBB domain